jgi:hypothetical protein
MGSSLSLMHVVPTKDEIIRAIQENRVALLYPSQSKCPLRKWMRSAFIVREEIEVSKHHYKSPLYIAAKNGKRCDAVFNCLFNMLKDMDRDNITLLPSLLIAIETSERNRFDMLWQHIDIKSLYDEQVEMILVSLVVGFKYQHQLRACNTLSKDPSNIDIITEQNSYIFRKVWNAFTPLFKMNEWLDTQLLIKDEAINVLRCEG